MKKRFVITVISLLAAVLPMTAPALAGQQRQMPGSGAAADKVTGALPSVDQVLDRCVQAVGGKAAIEKITSLSSVGSFEAPEMNITGPAEIVVKSPNKLAVTVEIPSFGAVKEGYDGTTGWAYDPNSGLRDVTGAELEGYKRQADLQIDLHMKQVYKSLAVTGKEKVNGKDAYVVQGTPPEGGSEKMYFDVDSGLMVRSDVINHSPQGEVPAEVYFDDYREVSGVKLPYTIRQNSQALSFTIKFTELKANVPVDDSKFAKPHPSAQ